MEVLNIQNDEIKKKFLKSVGFELVNLLESKNEQDMFLSLQNLVEKKITLPDRSEVSLLSILKELDWYWFFTQVGLNQGISFFTETYRRIEEGFLPPLTQSSEVLYVVNELFGKDAERLLSLQGPLLEKIDPLLQNEKSDFFSFWQQPLLLSIENLSQRISGLALDSLIAQRLRKKSELTESFLKLGRIHFNSSPDVIKHELTNALVLCGQAIGFIQSLSKDEGVSLSLTYRLLQIEQLMNRLWLLIGLIDSPKGSINQKGVLKTCTLVLQNHFENIKLRQFLVRNFEILAYQITVISQRTGEHYVSKNSTELLNMWVKAIKGALVVALLVFIKVQLSKIGYPPLIEAFTFGSLYAFGFVVIHLTGGVLATKQPAMTASTLAAAMDESNSSQESLNNLSESIINILRTQVAALLGNYLFSFPFALLLSLPFLVTQHRLVDFHKADHMIESLHPLLSLSLMYAAIAGVCLFLSGLISGLASNWFAFNKISDRLKNRFSSKRSERSIHFLKDNFGVLTGNIVLGYMLGSMAAMGKMSGLPLDIRHVTFASGSFAIGWSQKENLMNWESFSLIAAGVLLIGFINLTVSFSLSLIIAMKSRRLKMTQGQLIFKIVLKKLIKNPRRLFWHL